MEFEYESSTPEDVLRVLKNVALRREARFNGSDTSLRITWSVWPGGMAGAGAAGLSIPLSERHLVEGFDASVGNSIGVPICVSAVAYQAKLCAEIILNECTRPDFISWERWRNGGSVFNFLRLERVLRDSLNIAQLYASPTDVWAVVTELETARRRLLNVKRDHPDPIHTVMAALCIPKLCVEEYKINGKQYVDGVCTSIFPAKKMMELYKPTDMLIFANRPRDWKPPLRKRLYEELLLYRYPRELRKAMRIREGHLQTRIEYLRQQKDVNYLIIYPKEDIDMFCNERYVLEDLCTSGEAYMRALLKEAGV